MYKKKILFSLMLGVLSIAPVFSCANATEIQEADNNFKLLMAQIQNVKGYFKGFEVNNSAGAIESFSSSSAEIDVPVHGDHTIHRRLVLGVSTKEVHYGNPDGDMPTGHSLLNRFDASYVFLNDRHDEDPENPVNNRALTLDFNDLAQLRYLSTNMNSFFDQIVVDDSTFKDMIWIDKLTSKEMAWGAEHLQEMKNLLKLGGQFIFGPTADRVWLVDKTFANQDEVYQDVEKQIQGKSFQFITDYTLPYFLPISYLYREEVDARLNLYLEIQRLESEKLRTERAKEKNLDWHEYFLSSTEKILRTISNQSINSFHIKAYILRNYLVPLNYRPLCESVFGVQNIKIDYDVPLPFDSNYKKTQSVLFTLTKEAGTGGSVSSWQ